MKFDLKYFRTEFCKIVVGVLLLFDFKLRPRNYAEPSTTLNGISKDPKNIAEFKFSCQFADICRF